jgi:Fur family zinc uptake transcriptional regulator
MSGSNSKNPVAFERNDHRSCQHQLLSRAKALCVKRNKRLTHRRLQVLEILLRSHAPVRAYEILAYLNEAETTTMIAPPIVYRALEFLLEEGLAHRIESKNAFISCAHPGHHSGVRFLICSGCEQVAELENPDALLITEAANLGFSVDHSVVEISGYCAECQKNGG